ncbi:hypothetical protein IPG36_06250 [bacterium]|nr:MAG: hypothetical protein IPG36_06250 [bacterium]
MTTDTPDQTPQTARPRRSALYRLVRFMLIAAVLEMAIYLQAKHGADQQAIIDRGLKGLQQYSEEAVQAKRNQNLWSSFVFTSFFIWFAVGMVRIAWATISSISSSRKSAAQPGAPVAAAPNTTSEPFASSIPPLFGTRPSDGGTGALYRSGMEDI